MRFYDLEMDDDRNVYVCGGNNEVSDKVFLYRVDADSGVYEALLTKADVTALGGTGLSDCENVVVSGDTIVVDDLSGSQIVTSNNGGTTWAKTTVGQISDLVLSDSTIYGSGGTTGDGPDFYMATASAPSSMTSSNVDVDITDLQEARAIVSLDDALIIAGAYDTDTDDSGNAVNPGVWVRYSDDEGDSWTEAEITDTSDFSFIRAMVCPTTTQCLAAGDLYPSTQGGYIMGSEDGGLTWEALDLGETPATVFYSMTAFGDTVWVAGDGSDLFRIELE